MEAIQESKTNDNRAAQTRSEVNHTYIPGKICRAEDDGSRTRIWDRQTRSWLMA